MIVAGLTAYLRGVEGRLREAELAQARAETKAAGEPEPAVDLALAASVLGTVLFGAAGWGWTDRERRRRKGELCSAVDPALAEASKKRSVPGPRGAIRSPGSKRSRRPAAPSRCSEEATQARKG